MNLLDGTKVSKFNIFFLFVVIVYAAGASRFVHMYGDVRTLGNWFIAILAAVFAIRNNVKITKVVTIPLAVFALYAIMTTLHNGVINPVWMNKWFLTIVISYSLCYVYGKRFFPAYETIVYYMAIITIVCWILHLAFPDPFTQFAKAIRFSRSYSQDFDTINFIFYTINDEEHLSLMTRLFLRNAGFAWEPGAYSVFLCLAIFCNAMRTNFSLKGNRSLIVFIIALITTQSTTGYSIFFVMILLWLMLNKKYKVALLLIPLMIFVNTLPFMGDKISSQQTESSEFSLADIDPRLHYNVNRFTAFKIYLQEYLRHPILGLGGYDDGTWLRKNGYDNIALASGIGQMMAMYGTIMTALYFFLLFTTVKKIKEEVSANGLLMIVPIAGMLISYTIWLRPLFITFAFWGYFTGRMNTKQQVINKI